MKIDKYLAAVIIALSLSFAVRNIADQTRKIEEFYNNPQLFAGYEANKDGVKKWEYLGIKTTTAYNPVPEQTDSSPCVGANNINVCDILKSGKGVCAANFLPIGQIIYVDGYGECVVADRTSKKYKDRVDVLFAANDIEGSKKWGKRQAKIMIISPQ